MNEFLTLGLYHNHPRNKTKTDAEQGMVTHSQCKPSAQEDTEIAAWSM